MSNFPTMSAFDASTQTFPILTHAQIDRMRAASRSRSVAPGEILFRPGDTTVPFFVILSGEMEIVQPSFSGERPITTHGPGHFSGEVSMISGQRCLVLGRVTQAGEFLEMDVPALRSMIARDSELSEILMRAFILRRLALINKNFGNVVVMGSLHSAGTLRIREFSGATVTRTPSLTSTPTKLRKSFWTVFRSSWRKFLSWFAMDARFCATLLPPTLPAAWA